MLGPRGLVPTPLISSNNAPSNNDTIPQDINTKILTDITPYDCTYTVDVVSDILNYVRGFCKS